MTSNLNELNIKTITNSYVENQLKSIDDKLKSRILHLKSFNNPYIDNGMIDPMCSMNKSDGSPILTNNVNVLAVRKRRSPDRILTFDIESYGLRPDLMHLAYAYDPQTDEYFRFRGWNNQYGTERTKAGNGKIVESKKLTEYGAIDFFEQLLMQNMGNPERTTTHVYAHNGSGFDYVGLAYAIISNCSLDPFYLDEMNAKQVPDHLKKVHLNLDIISREDAGFLRKGLWYNCPPLLRKKSFFNDETGRKNAVTIKWELVKAGHRAYIQLSMGLHTIKLIDSYWHLNMPLSALGAKGLTPLQYTNPEAWLKQERAAGRIPEGVRDLVYWYRTLDPNAEEYCRSDCKILADALADYRKVYGDLFRDPGTNEPLDPLAFITSAQSGLTGMVVKSTMPRLKDSGSVLLHQPGSQWREERRISVLSELIDKGNVVQREVPFAAGNETVIVPSGYVQRGKYLREWMKIQYGGRTEIFQPQNTPGTRLFVIDANSLYPSMMSSNQLKYFNPNNIRDLKENIKGKKAIQAHLKKFGGMYLLKRGETVNPIIKRLPVFPVRIKGGDHDERLAFPDHEGVMVSHVTSEELSYFLDNTDVVDDNIEILAEGSYYSELIEANKTPFYNFAGSVYAQRVRARRKGNITESEYLKLILNSGGYGVMVQINHSEYFIQEDSKEANERTISHMYGLSPSWAGWEAFESGETDIFNTAVAWCADHYTNWHRVHPTNPNKIAPRHMKISLPSKLADHAIRAFGCSITAHGRVALHKAILATQRADIRDTDTKSNIRTMSVLYCDTDSLYIQVPSDMSDEAVINRLQEVKVYKDGRSEQAIKIGENLGEWKHEEQYANPSLVTEKSDVTKLRSGKYKINNPQGIFFAPKHYYITDTPGEDRKFNVLKDVVKAVPKWSTLMRATMFSFYVQTSKLGDPRGIKIEEPAHRDMIKTIAEGKEVRRIYDGPYLQSKPLLLKHSVPKMDNPTYHDYMKRLSDNTFGKSKGIREALSNYRNNALIMDRTFRSMHSECKDIYQELRESIVYGDGTISSNYNIAMSKIMETSAVDKGTDPISDNLPI